MVAGAQDEFCVHPQGERYLWLVRGGARYAGNGKQVGKSPVTVCAENMLVEFIMFGMLSLAEDVYLAACMRFHW